MITAAMRAEMRRLVLVECWKIETVARRYDIHHAIVRRAQRDDAGERPAPTALSPRSSRTSATTTAPPAAAQPAPSLSSVDFRSR